MRRCLISEDETVFLGKYFEKFSSPLLEYSSPGRESLVSVSLLSEGLQPPLDQEGHLTVSNPSLFFFYSFGAMSVDLVSPAKHVPAGSYWESMRIHG